MNYLGNKNIKLFKRLLFAWLFVVVAFPLHLFSQDPTFFQTTTENGLPSNEIYCLLQDNKGYVWFGCDAGIYRYDGVKYKQYKSKEQRSRAFTGLTLSKSGRVYAYTFNGQLFYAENDSLYCLNDWKGKVSNIVCDKEGNLWVCGDKGLCKYNERTKSWKVFDDFDGNGRPDEFLFTRSCEVRGNVLWFICDKGLGTVENDKLTLIPFAFPEGSVCGDYELAVGKRCTWLFHRSKALFYKCENKQITVFKSDYLSKRLNVSKFNDLRELDDDLLYIPTYTGLIIYNPQTDEGNLLYPNKAISYVLFDREKSCWLSTLQGGILRIPNPDIKQWKLNNNEEVSKKINKIITVNNKVYCSNISGQLACLDPADNNLNVYSTDIKADIQCLSYDSTSKCVYFNINNSLYQFKDEKLKIINTSFPSAKFIYPVNKQFIVASSFGLYLYDDVVGTQPKKWLLTSWTREICFDKLTKRLFIASNDGIVIINPENDTWKIKDTLLKQKQINSICYDDERKVAYTLSFDDKIYSINEANKVNLVFDFPSFIHVSQVRLKNNQLFLASNIGLIIYDIQKKSYLVVNKLDGLSSNEVLGISFLDDKIYLATSLGINQLPFTIKQKPVLSKLYLDAVLVDNKKIDTNKLTFDYDQLLSLKLSGLSFSSNATFNYAYRFVNADSLWINLPATIESLDFQSLPYGDFTLEVKLIDHLGRDSENTLMLQGKIKPPFWLDTWFLILEAILLIGILLILFRYRLKKLRMKQLEELKKIKLENELRLVQQSALKAQMNPHFIFNVLNSIKGYIYDNDKKNAVLYLSDFSELMRKILDTSSSEKIKLSEEIEILKVYMDLEAMLLEGEFESKISIDEQLDIDSIQIPGLLIQPYVENAFKHGLRHKKGLKLLTLDLALNGNSLVVTISDNGVGLRASKEINEQGGKTHQSFATNATARRIELLNYNTKDVVHVRLIDNINEQNESNGTTIVLTIQLN